MSYPIWIDLEMTDGGAISEMEMAHSEDKDAVIRSWLNGALRDGFLTIKGYSETTYVIPERMIRSISISARKEND